MEQTSTIGGLSTSVKMSKDKKNTQSNSRGFAWTHYPLHNEWGRPCCRSFSGTFGQAELPWGWADMLGVASQSWSSPVEAYQRWIHKHPEIQNSSLTRNIHFTTSWSKPPRPIEKLAIGSSKIDIPVKFLPRIGLKTPSLLRRISALNAKGTDVAKRIYQATTEPQSDNNVETQRYHQKSFTSSWWRLYIFWRPWGTKEGVENFRWPVWYRLRRKDNTTRELKSFLESMIP